MTVEKKYGLGLIGCGSFGQFCLKAISKMPEIEIKAVADSDEKLVSETAHYYNCKEFTLPDDLIEDPEIEIIHIVTPPYTHYELGENALKAKKHVICEKPLALSFSDGEQLLRMARENQVIIPVNFVLRYTAVTEIIKSIISEEILGKPLRAFFENYATDESLTDDHWFWDKQKSGGIFVEHGVHFFDLYRYWFGELEAEWAYTQYREGYQKEDRVFCFMKHENEVLSNHYHGFDQPAKLDRQMHKISFEYGDITIHGWIPESFTIHGLIDKDDLGKLSAICPQGKIEKLEDIPENQHQLSNRNKFKKVFHQLLFNYNSSVNKETLYSTAIQSLFEDQIKYVNNHKHMRKITEDNGLRALKIALKADEFVK